MARTFNILLVAVAVVGADAAFAQAMGGPAPGTTDSKAVVRESQETNEEFNRQVGSKDQKPRKRRGVAAATAADLVSGSAVRDPAGTQLGTIESVDANGVVIVSAAGKVSVPADSFGKDKSGLLLAIGKAEFDAAVRQANAAPQG